MNGHRSRHQRSPEEHPSSHHCHRSGWRGYLQGIQMGAFLLLLCNLPDVLILDLTTSSAAGLLIWWLRLTSGILLVCWLFLALQIGAGSREDTPQAEGLVTMFLPWLAEQSVFLLLATSHG